MLAWTMEGILIAVMGVSPNLWFALLLALLTGVATGLINVPSETAIQQYGKENTGKIFSFWLISIWFGQLLSLAIFSPLFKWFSIEFVFGLSGSILAILGILGVLFTREVNDKQQYSTSI